MDDITGDYVREVLHYSPDTGIFTWRVKLNRRINIGSIAGYNRTDKYKIVRINKKQYRASRLAWLYMTNAHPINDIDHIDGNPTNNIFSNLRDVTTAENIQNQKRAHKRNKSGFLGVSWHIAGKRWRARICADNKQIVLGYFNTPEEAHQAYLIAKRKYHPACTI
jgi:hypothetical protein